MNFVVIDKSWLQAISAEKLKEFVTNRILLFPAALGYELFTAETEAHLIDGFKKLIAVQQSINLIDHVGSFLSFESENKAPCTPIENLRYPIEFEFHPDLTKPNFPFAEEDKQHIEDFRDHWEITGVDGFKKVSAGVSYWFPELREIKAGSSREKIQPVLEKLARDFELVKQIYSKYRLDYFPPAEIIDENWAHFRWLQIKLIAGIEYIRKYGAGNIDIIGKYLAHDNLDLQYCVTGILARALATDDKQIKFYFQLCCPNGKLYSNKVRE